MTQGLVPIARSGGGPGEVMRPTSLALAGDSVMAVQDGGQRRAMLFDRTTMQPPGSIAMGWLSTSIQRWRDGLVVGAFEASNTVYRWNLASKQIDSVALVQDADGETSGTWIARRVIGAARC